MEKEMAIGIVLNIRPLCVHSNGLPQPESVMEDTLAPAMGNVTLDEGLFVELGTATLSASSNSVINVP